MTELTRKIQRFLAATMVVVMLAVQPAAGVLADPDPGASSTPTTAPSDQTATPPSDSTTTSPSTTPSDTSSQPAQTPAASTNPPSTSSSPAPQTQAPSPDPQSTRGPSGPTGPQQPTSHPPAYAFNDATRKWEPVIASSFSWDYNAHQWSSPFYRLDPTVGWWHVIPGVTPSDAINALTAGSGDPSSLLNSILGVDPSNSNTGPNSSNAASVTNTNKVLAELLNNFGINNNINSTANTGDASVSGNTLAGNAISGAASIVSNLLNLLNAMWSFSSGGFASFVQNVFGNQTGDINITPPAVSGGGGQLGACAGGVATNDTTGPDSTNTAQQTCSSDLTVKNKTNGTIVNNVNLAAQTGNASVTGNTQGGSATSGDASAELNIVNLINTAIGAGQSFFGMINIYGNLNGDILFPTLGLNGSVASSSGGPSVSNSNTGPDSTNNASVSNSNNATFNNKVNAAFNNNVNATATSGNANVSDNTSAGDATTGNASTNNSLFNLFNTNVFGDNAVLVIINDMGHWVGQIMNLGGDGSLGGLLTSNATVSNSDTGPNSTNNASVSNTNNANVTNEVNGSITNNVTASAKTGDATVSDNTKAGGATSGNAKVASDIANIFGSQLSFSHVFGILFINVFGSWTGSVGVDTAAGNPVVTLAQFVPAGSGSISLPDASQFAQNSGGFGASSSGAPMQHLIKPASNSHSLSNAVTAAARTAPQAAAAVATRNTGLLIVAAAVMLMLAATTFGLDRRYNR